MMNVSDRKQAELESYFVFSFADSALPKYWKNTVTLACLHSANIKHENQEGFIHLKETI